MSIIQHIREKYAAVIIVAIAVSLIAFILMDAFVGRGRGSGTQNSSTIAKINGQKVDINVFRERLDEQEQQYQQSGMKVDDALRQQIMQATWSQLIDERLMNAACEQLGMQITAKELSDALFGKNPPQFMLQSFTDKATGQYDATKAREYFAAIKNRSSDSRAQMAQVYIDRYIQELMFQKYISLFAQAAYIPKWLSEKQMVDNGAIAKVSLVQIPYSIMPDSAVRVSDDDIKKYINEHKKEYIQDEMLRSIAYTYFSAAPTKADSAAALEQVKINAATFSTIANIQDFLNQVGTEKSFYDGYIGKQRVQMPLLQKDSIEKGKTIVGPYVDGKSYVLARVLGNKNIPDSVKCRHILIATRDLQTGQLIVEDSIAKKRIDSIAMAIKTGASFDAMAKMYSNDLGSKDKGGVYDYFSQGQMTPSFNSFCFEGRTNDKGVIKTEYGYHYIEVLDQKNIGPAYKIAYLSKPIDASQETINNANNAAAQFSGESRTMQAFENSIKKANRLKLIAQDIREIDYTIPNLGASRSLIKWVYEHGVGEVSEPFAVEDKYIVAAIIGIEKEGTMSVAKLKPMLEPILRNQKKAEKIKNKIDKITSLEAVAASFGMQITQADSINFASTIIPNIGVEPKVCGAVFNKAWKGKASEPITGNTGVFVIRTENISAQPVMNVSNQQMQLKSNAAYRTIEALRKSAIIKDYRSKFY